MINFNMMHCVIILEILVYKIQYFVLFFIKINFLTGKRY
jgi:hypothetical protein